jgi:hypothetical protein
MPKCTTGSETEHYLEKFLKKPLDKKPDHDILGQIKE